MTAERVHLRTMRPLVIALTSAFLLGACSIVSSTESGGSGSTAVSSVVETTSSSTLTPVGDSRPASYPIVPLPGCGDVDLVHGDIAISQDRLVPGGDFDQLRDFSGAALALAVIEGTVVEQVGTPVTPRRNGYTDYETATGYPQVRLVDLEMVTELRDRDSGVPLGELHDLVDGNEIVLRHAGGYVEPGGRYAFFVGLWQLDEFSMLYAHNLETDLPAHGFLSEASKRMLENMEAFDPEGCNLDRVIDLARESWLAENGEETSGLLESVSSPSDPVAIEEVLKTNLASTDLAGAFRTDLGEVMIVEILILADEPGVYTLRGEKDFGRAPINDHGSTIILGFVPPGTKFDSIVYTDSDGEPHQISTAELGLDDDALTLTPDGETGTVSVVLDLTKSGVAADKFGGSRFIVLPLAEFMQIVPELTG